MPPLHRHQLAQLTDDGWRRVRAQPRDDMARECLRHWADRRLPLVVARQPPQRDDGLALGLPAPLCWQRRRIALQVHRTDVAWFDEFPQADAIEPLLPARGRAAWQRLCVALASLGVTARVYGSHGWQHLSGLLYLRTHSDVDLWAAVGDARQADAVAAVLARFDAVLPRRVDGELLLPDGRAFAWREWQAWRTGRSRAILCKTLHAVTLLPERATHAAARGAAPAQALP